MVSAELALSVAFRASIVALTIGFLEQLAVFDRAFGPRGPFSAVIAEIFGRKGARNASFSSALRVILLTGAAAGIVGAIAGPYPPLGRIAGLGVLACIAATRLRRVTASDGAEQMAILTLIATCIAMLPGLNETALTIAVWFIAGQSILSYATAGVAKAISPTWTDGGAVPLIMSSESHGQPWISALLDAHPGVGKLLTRSVILFECAFPFILIAPAEIVVVLMAAGFAFHLGCAVTMGLNAFLLAFPGSYLCVACVAHTTSPYW